MKYVGLALILALAAAMPCVGAMAATETALYKFKGGGGFADGNNGSLPMGSLFRDSTGTLFGTTNFGGSGCGSNGPGCGTVFKIAPPAPGKTNWTLKFLASFKDGVVGSYPVAGVIMGPDGLLYGTTTGGGNGVSSTGDGIVFKLTPPPPGSATVAWSRTTLYRFAGGSDGATPQAKLLMDSTGALYGTTEKGGPNNDGTVFKLTPPAPGKKAWTETVLYAFAGGTDGARPLSGLLMGAGGVLYGTTVAGGSGQGTVFSLTPPAPGGTAWTETVLYRFAGGDDGAFPSYADLAADAAGVLYGTTNAGGGAANMGTVFKLTPPARGRTTWIEKVLHRFRGKRDGANPNAGVVLDSSGALYGTTQNGGAANLGLAFKLTPPAAGATTWTETVLHGFTGGSDGANPWSGVTLDSNNAVFGTTLVGGGACPNQFAGGCGTVFEITP